MLHLKKLKLRESEWLPKCNTASRFQDQDVHPRFWPKAFGISSVPYYRFSPSNVCPYPVMCFQHLFMSWNFSHLLHIVSKFSGLKKWVYTEMKIFLKITYMLWIQNMNLILNRNFLITNTIFNMLDSRKIGKSASQDYLHVN